METIDWVLERLKLGEKPRVKSSAGGAHEIVEAEQ